MLLIYLFSINKIASKYCIEIITRTHIIFTIMILFFCRSAAYSMAKSSDFYFFENIFTCLFLSYYCNILTINPSFWIRIFEFLSSNLEEFVFLITGFLNVIVIFN